ADRRRELLDSFHAAAQGQHLEPDQHEARRRADRRGTHARRRARGLCRARREENRRLLVRARNGGVSAGVLEALPREHTGVGGLRVAGRVLQASLGRLGNQRQAGRNEGTKGRSAHRAVGARREASGISGRQEAAMSEPTTIKVVAASDRDVPLILQMIRDLAEYERMSDQVVATEAGLREVLFGPRPQAEVLVAYAGERPAGFALFFHNFSTFVGRRGLYLEDLFVKPELRGAGIGKRLLAELARIAVERDCGRFEWSVLDWNEPAIGFYKKLGAVPMADWTIFRVSGDALTRLAHS